MIANAATSDPVVRKPKIADRASLIRPKYSELLILIIINEKTNGATNISTSDITQRIFAFLRSSGVKSSGISEFTGAGSGKGKGEEGAGRDAPHSEQNFPLLLS